MKILSIMTLLFIVTLACGKASANQDAQVLPNWTLEDRKKCLIPNVIESRKCFPDFVWRNDGFPIPQDMKLGTREAADDIFSDIIDGVSTKCSELRIQKNKKHPSDVAPAAFTRELRKATSAVKMIGGSESEAEEFFSAAGNAIAFIDLNISCLHNALEHLKNYREWIRYNMYYRDKDIVEFSKNKSNWQKIDESNFMKNGGIGFITVIGKDVAEGKVCGLFANNELEFSSIVVSDIPESELPTGLTSLRYWKNGDTLSFNEIGEKFSNYHPAGNYLPHHNSECAIIYSDRAGILKVRSIMQNTFGFGTWIYPQIINQNWIDKALAKRKKERDEQQARSAAERPARIANNQKVAKDHRDALNFFRTNPQFDNMDGKSCVVELSRVISYAERIGETVSSYANGQAMSDIAPWCMRFWYSK